MTKNTLLNSAISCVCFSMLIFVSCESHEPKQNDAFQQYKKEKMLTNDSSISAIPGEKPKTVAPETVKPKTAENQDDWSRFRKETERKISLNENKITTILNNPASSSKMKRKAGDMAKRNKDYRVQLDEYQKTEKINRENFKTMMNEDIKELDLALAALTVADKKQMPHPFP